MFEVLLILEIVLPILLGFAIYLIKIPNRNLKNLIILITSIIVFILNIVLLNKEVNITLFSFAKDLNVGLFVDKLASYFALSISLVFIFLFIYSFEYLKHEDNENSFYLYFILSYASLIGMCYSANIITAYVFFELVTLLSFPLVMHSKSKESIHAAMKYLFYSIGGAFLALIGVFFVVKYSSGATFKMNGNVDVSLITNKNLYLVGVLFMIVGFGAKAGMFPLHAWLPSAHPVAPSNASAALSGIIAKAGVFMVIRSVYYCVGYEYLRNSFVQYTWIVLVVITILLGSGLALFCKNLKKRLAYSTVSQVSYIMLGLAFLNKVAFAGALLHVVGHMLIKVCLFMSAGGILYKEHKRYVDELENIGLIMPKLMICFSLCSIALVGVPFTLTFFSKWSLAIGILENVNALSIISVVTLLVSAILTAFYLLPIMKNGFFTKTSECPKNDVNYLMTIPLVSLTVLVFIFGLFSNHLVDFINLMF